jgi:hypothetical protein
LTDIPNWRGKVAHWNAREQLKQMILWLMDDVLALAN